MKIQAAAAAVALSLAMSGASAFSSISGAPGVANSAVAPPPPTRRGGSMPGPRSGRPLQAERRDVVAAALGWALLSGVALPPPAIAASQSYESLDFSLPSYDSKKTGFGDGTEAFLDRPDGMKSGGAEAEKQAAAMKKAEEARKVRLAEKKEAEKERLADISARNRASRFEKKDRFKEIFQ